MYFEQVLPALREGKKVKVYGWDTGCFICYKDGYIIDENGNIFQLKGMSVIFSNWEIINEPKKHVVYVGFLKHNEEICAITRNSPYSTDSMEALIASKRIEFTEGEYD